MPATKVHAPSRLGIDRFRAARSFLIGLFVWMLLSGSVAAQTFYHENLGLGNVNEYATAVVNLPGGGVIVGGSTGNDALLMRLDAAGGLVWTKRFAAPSAFRQKIQHLAVTADGFIIGTGYTDRVVATTYPNEGFVFKLDLNGNSIWTQVETHPTNVWLYRIVPDGIGSYLVLAGRDQGSGGTWVDFSVLRLDAATGAVLDQSDRIDLGPTNYLDTPAGMDIDASGNVYVTGRLYCNGAANTSMRPYLVQLSPALDVNWARYYFANSAVSARIYGSDICIRNGTINIFTIGNNTSSNGDYTCGIIHLDLSGAILWHRDYDLPTSLSEVSWRFAPTSTGYYMLGQTPTFRLFSIETDTAGAITRTQYLTPAGVSIALEPWTAAMDYSHGRIALAATDVTNPDLQMVVASFDSQATIPCQPFDPAQVTQTFLPHFETTTPYFPASDPIAFSAMGACVPVLLPDPCIALVSPLGPDTLLCGTSLLLDATTAGATGYVWQDGSTSPTFTATAAGTYTVIVSIGCCNYLDSIQVSMGGPLPVGMPDSILCSGDSIVLQPTVAGNAYLWSTGDTTPTLVVGSPGTYSVTIGIDTACTATDTVVITAGTRISFDLGPDREHCGRDRDTIVSPILAASYLWSTGDTTATLIVDSTGTYSLTVPSDCGPVTDAIHIELIVDDRHFIPNVFSPNGDGIHDQFVVEGPIYDEYRLEIMDRWGHRLFVSEDIDQSWDGRLQAADCPEGVYFYVLRVVNCDRLLDYKAGSVTLLR